ALGLFVAMSSATAAEATTGSDVAIDSSGRIVVAGTTNNTFAVARYKPSGKLDPSFGDDGKVTVGFGPGCSAEANALAIDGSGRIVIAGSRSCPPTGVFVPTFALARLKPGGRLDPTFGSNGKVTASPPVGNNEDVAYAVAIDSAGRIVAAGDACGYY